MLPPVAGATEAVLELAAAYGLDAKVNSRGDIVTVSGDQTIGIWRGSTRLHTADAGSPGRGVCAVGSGGVDFAALAKEKELRRRTQEAQAKAAGVTPAPARKAAAAGGLSSSITGGQKALLILAAVLFGPAIQKEMYDKATSEKVDLSDFNIVTHYDEPAITRMDDTVRIQFCAN